MNSITLAAPATVANLSCGFDILGACIEKPFDKITVAKNATKNVIINIDNSPFSNIPSDPKKNTGGVPAELIIQDYNLDFGFTINIEKGIPLCGGLGSSAATAAGVVYGINELLDKKLSLNKMIKYALKGEEISSESPHVDNIGPCLMGGLVLVRDTKSLDLVNILTGDLFFAVVHPDIKIDTKSARKMLPDKVELNSAVKQWGNIAGLTYGFSSHNINLIKRSMEDCIIEPIRSKLIPGYLNIKKSALYSGAICCSISGSGPSIFALCDNQDIAQKVVLKMEKELQKLSIKYHSYVSPINKQGIEILQYK